jgi:hypothetical protein
MADVLTGAVLHVGEDSFVVFVEIVAGTMGLGVFGCAIPRKYGITVLDAMPKTAGFPTLLP